MELRTDAASDHVGQGSAIVHAHVILVFEALDLAARHTLRHRLVSYVHRVVHPWDRLGCVAHIERVLGRSPTNSMIVLPLVSSMKQPTSPVCVSALPS